MPKVSKVMEDGKSICDLESISTVELFCKSTQNAMSKPISIVKMQTTNVHLFILIKIKTNITSKTVQFTSNTIEY